MNMSKCTMIKTLGPQRNVLARQNVLSKLQHKQIPVGVKASKQGERLTLKENINQLMYHRLFLISDT